MLFLLDGAVLKLGGPFLDRHSTSQIGVVDAIEAKTALVGPPPNVLLPRLPTVQQTRWHGGELEAHRPA